MAQMRRFFLHPIRGSLSVITSPSPPLLASRNSVYWKFLPLKAWAKGFEPAICNRGLSSHWKLCMQRHRFGNLSKSGRNFSIGRICGLSVIFGSMCLWPRIAYALDGLDVFVDDHHLDLLVASEAEENYRNILAFVRKLLLPIFLVATVVTNWGRPIILLTKVILILISTKPSPFSVYLFIEQLRHQFMNQYPFLYKFKSLYATKVEVEDYTFLCLAQVELKEQSFTLIGILGSWWVFPLLPVQEALAALRNRAFNHLRQLDTK